MREAMRCDPTFATAHNGLGFALATKGSPKEALVHYREAIRLDPNLPDAHFNLGLALAAVGESDDAIKHCERAVEIEPKSGMSHYYFGQVLQAASRGEDAIEQFEQTLQLDPKLADAHHRIGIILAEARRMDEAVFRFQRAIKLDPKHALAYGGLGEAYLTQARFAESLAATTRFVELLSKDDPYQKKAGWFLNRCKTMIRLDGRLSAVLQGKDKPANPKEYLDFTELCRIKKQYGAATRFITEALAREPTLSADLRTHHRYNAACLAALAGCGRGEDADMLGDVERKRLRKQARVWLQADLVLWDKILKSGPPKDGAAVGKAMTYWRKDPDLAGIRDPIALEKLPPDEREECMALWNEAGAVFKRAQESK